MYDAERAAPRNVRVLTAAARELRVRRASMASALDLALERRDGLSIDYVPRVDPVSRAVFGVRARPRWPPAERDPHALAAILGGDPALAERLARWTLRQACRDGGHWLAGGCALRLAVELPAALAAAPDFASGLPRALAEAGFEPLLLDLELAGPPAPAPGSGDDELDRLAAALAEIRALGPRIALAHVDDGCALRELHRLPLDGLAVDRAAIDRLGPGLWATLARVARGLELRLAVADVDAPAALAALDPHEPDELAGALFGAAVPASLVPELVRAPTITRRDLAPMLAIDPAIDATVD
jgi:EAL domain-containing protein (putative c-di-GMP-specific phosphodiesterase class I)